ncbi:MAG: retropepsin-like aspartic protease [Bacteroidia bacterium]
MKKTTVPIRLLRLNDLGYHFVFRIKINGKQARMLIDTGASNTVFDKSRIAAFLKEGELTSYNKLSTGLGTNSMETMATLIDKLELGMLTIRSYPAMILDLSHVNISYAGMNLHPIDGVLGGDILKKHRAVIDCGKKTMTLWLPVARKKKKKS